MAARLTYLAFRTEYANITKTTLAATTAIILWKCSNKYLLGGKLNLFGQSGQPGHDNP